MKKTIAIMGAGPGLGLSIAKKFGANGFQVALISRNEEKLNTLVQELQALNIEAAAFPADVYNKEQVATAFDNIKKNTALSMCSNSARQVEITLLLLLHK